MFVALDWDVGNHQGYAEQYKNVINTDAINIGGAIKAPDYCFHIGSVRKFILEAKRLSVNLKEDPEPVYQPPWATPTSQRLIIFYTYGGIQWV